MIKNLIAIVAFCSIPLIVGCDSGGSSSGGSSSGGSSSGGSSSGGSSVDDSDQSAVVPDATTDFAVSVVLPEGSQVVDNSININPVDWLFGKAFAVDEAQTGLDLSNFQVRLYNEDATEFEDVQIDEFIDNGDGTYSVSVPGDPRVDCILVSVLQVNGQQVELQIPATDAGSQAEPLEISYASTAATEQYITQIVESGGFDENLSVEEVTALVDTVVEQVASIILPDGVDANDPNAVIAALAANAGDIVEAQVEIALAPEPEPGSLLAFQGNYHGGIISRFVFGSDVVAGGNLEMEVINEDYTFAPAATPSGKEASLAGVPIVVDENAKTATITFGSATETVFGVRYQVPELFSDQESVAGETEQLVAPILPGGKIIVNPGGGLVEDGSSFNSGGEDFYFAQVNNSRSFDLIPWGQAYVSSGFLEFTEYRLNDCFGALGVTDSALTDINQQQNPSDAFEDLVDGLNSSLSNAAAIIANECQASGSSHEVIALTLAKEAENISQDDIAGDWGVVGLSIATFSRSVFSSVLTLDDQGSLSEAGLIEATAGFDMEGLEIEVDVEPGDIATYTIASDGILEINWGDDVDAGYISADQGLLHLTGSYADESDSGETFMLFGIPLASNVTAVDLNGKTFEAVGLAMSLEINQQDEETILSENQDSYAGLTLTFALNGENLEVTLGGSTDLGIFDRTSGPGGVSDWNVDVQLNDPVEGTLPVSLNSNGEFTIEIDGQVQGEDEDLLLRGFYGANGRLIVSLFNSGVGGLALIDSAAENGGEDSDNGFSEINFGYLLATCSAGCN